MIDKMPGEFRDSLPLSAKLYLTAQEVFKAKSAEVISVVEAKLPELTEHLTTDEINNARRQNWPHFASHPSSLLGGDTIEKSFLIPPGSSIVEDQYMTFSLQLSEDGSPFVPEAIIGGMEESSFIGIFISAEQKPFYALIDQLETAPPDSNGIKGMPWSYIEMLRERREEPQWLSDDDMIELIRVLPELQLDVHETVTNNLNQYNPPIPTTST